jgi:hypothetical protein
MLVLFGSPWGVLLLLVKHWNVNVSVSADSVYVTGVLPKPASLKLTHRLPVELSKLKVGVPTKCGLAARTVVAMKPVRAIMVHVRILNFFICYS